MQAKWVTIGAILMVGPDRSAGDSWAVFILVPIVNALGV
jgi:hypothetical protein